MLTLNTPTSQINKIGKATAGKLKKLGILNVRNLLEYYPKRYEDYTQSVKIAQLTAGMSANVQGTLEFIQNKRSSRKRMNITEALISDGTAALKAVWFNQPFISRNLQVGDIVSLSGAVQADFPAQIYGGGAGMSGLQMTSPEYEKVTVSGTMHTRGLVPIYPLTGNLTNKQLRFLIKSVLPVAQKISDSLPKFILKKYNLVDIETALRYIHFPENKSLLAQAKRRLQFDELFFVQLATQVQKSSVKSQSAEKIKFYKKETKIFVDNLPFKLTDAQKTASWEILQDLGKDVPMSRLLEGDVGSGKTVTAALAMLNVFLNKKQSALLVPTEILATQHYGTLTELFRGNNMRIGLLTRSQRQISTVIASEAKQSRDDQDVATPMGLPRPPKYFGVLAMTKKDFLQKIKAGEVDIVVGTHAMIQEKIEFNNLALAIIDEQHRFGVDQRKALKQKSGHLNATPHLLSMTATPIPRSLAQVVYGDLDISIINQMPLGRKIIKTYLVPEHQRHDAYAFIKKQVIDGRQIFVVCPLISESDKLGVKSVTAEYEKLKKDIFPDFSMACLHGKLKVQEKEEIMEKFLDKAVNILVSTSVIEVGVDVPNATIMVIEGAERFGLAQLHQFRGRVGRSTHQSYCLLFVDSLKERARNRLEIFAKSNDGFKLAAEDLKMRGPGEVYGTAQKGFPEFKIATFEDVSLLKETRVAAINISEQGVDNYPALLAKLKDQDDWLVG